MEGRSSELGAHSGILRPPPAPPNEDWGLISLIPDRHLSDPESYGIGGFTKAPDLTKEGVLVALDPEITLPRSSTPPPQTNFQHFQAPKTPPRTSQNDQKWEFLKDEIHYRYIVENKSLPVTRNEISEAYGFYMSLVDRPSGRLFEKALTSNIEHVRGRSN